MRAELGIASDQLIVMALGSVQRAKGHWLLLDAMLRLENPNTHLVLVTGGVGPAYAGSLRGRVKRVWRLPLDNLDALLRDARQLGLTGRLHVTGFQRDVARVLSIADVLVFPSLQPEGFGRPIIEAMALAFASHFYGSAREAGAFAGTRRGGWATGPARASQPGPRPRRSAARARRARPHGRGRPTASRGVLHARSPGGRDDRHLPRGAPECLMRRHTRAWTLCCSTRRPGLARRASANTTWPATSPGHIRGALCMLSSRSAPSGCAAVETLSKPSATRSVHLGKLPTDSGCAAISCPCRTTPRRGSRAAGPPIASASACSRPRSDGLNASTSENGRRPILIAGLPHAVDVLPFVPHQALIYHCADDYAHVRGFPSTLPELEADLCQQADLVITTSETLCQSRRQFNPNTHWIPNGADIEHFSRPLAPAAELRSVPRPVIGFVGGLSEWVDIDLLASLALAKRDWSFVLIGPVGTDAKSIQHLPNVRLLGARPYAQVPSYLAAFDVALIPFKQDPVTYNADPIKAYEYLAAGVPIVATDLPALRRLEHVVRLADSPGSFLSQIEAALGEGRDAGRDARRQERQAEAARHSWDDRFGQFDRLLAEVLSNAARVSA